ncbi:MAG: hypothetical protein ACYC9L_09695 [Sulfuricaulis sp.]
MSAIGAFLADKGAPEALTLPRVGKMLGTALRFVEKADDAVGVLSHPLLWDWCWRMRKGTYIDGISSAG